MRIGMLGSLEVVTDDGHTIDVVGGRLRTLLIVLALDAGRAVSAARLVDGVWADSPPAGAANALQALVSRLRRAVPQAVVESHPAGYRLVLAPDAVDVARFERLAGVGRAALAKDPDTAARVLREALELWRGPALLDVAEADFFGPQLARLTELRLAALEDRVEADLRLGHGAGLTAELSALVTEHPLRERLVAALIRALCAAGRPGEALTAYERARVVLAETLGADPSAELSALHTAVLRGELSPVSTMDDPLRTNLRARLTSFVGRDDDLAQVGKLVGEYRLVTLTGPGGSGKTRLAGEVARALLDQTRDEVWLVELAAVTDGAGLPQAVQAALGLREQSVRPPGSAGGPEDRLASALRTRSAVLVLDNCEHLIEAIAALVERLLGECPRLRVLATSREPLGITGEAHWPVEPLALPPKRVSAGEAVRYAAVRLLTDRAHAARPGLTFTDETGADLVRICRALDGMPLAIELAAARLRTMTPAQLAARLDDRFRLLTGGARTALPRHQTLRAVVDWSWELLAEEERVLLRRLAVFAGGATVEAAERVCAGDAVAAGRVLDLLDALTDKSLLVTTGDGRYRMLETIKAYGTERLEAAGERDRIRRAHAAYFTGLAETADPYLRRAEQLVWLARLSAEHDNITVALRGAVEAGDAGAAVRLIAAAGWYWWLGGHKAEGAELTAAAIAMPGPVDPEPLAVACGISALFATAGLGDERQAAGMLRRAEELAGQVGWSHPVLRFLEPLGQFLRSAEEQAPPPVDAMGTLLVDEDPWVRAQARINRARTLQHLGRHAEARADAEVALAEFRTIGERWGISFALTVLADLIAQRGDLTGALELYQEAILVATEMGTEDVLWMRGRQAQLSWLLGDEEGAAAAIAAGERVAERVGWPDALAGLALATAEVARWAGDLPAARVQLARAEALLGHIVVHPVFRAMILDSLGYVEAAGGDLATARANRAEALALALDTGHAPTIAQVLIGVADQALGQHDPKAAARLLAASTVLRGAPDLGHPEALRLTHALRAALGDVDFAEAAREVADVTVATVPGFAALTLGG